MPLFRDHPVRSVIAAVIALSLGHYATQLLSSRNAFHLTQTSVAILAISSLVFMVTMHHRREGQLMTQTQEEMVLIGGFALFWIAVLMAWRTFKHHDMGLAMARVSDGQDSWPYPCAKDDLYCIVEEYAYF